MLKNFVVLLIVVLFITSCKSTRNTTSGIENISSKKLISKNKRAGFNKTRIKGNLSVKYIGNQELPNLNATLRMVKDSVLWLSFTKLGFPVAKLMITQKEVKFYEKISKTCFVGDFEFISKVLGVDFDFNMAQNLFLGETLLDLKSEKYKVLIINNFYKLVSINSTELYDVSFWINPINYKLVQEEITHKNKNQKLSIRYKNFDWINETLFTKGFIIQANTKKNKTIIDVLYKKIQFNATMRFPFKIPEGYTMIKIK